MAVETPCEFELEEHRQYHGRCYLALTDDFVNRHRRRTELFEHIAARRIQRRLVDRRLRRRTEHRASGFGDRATETAFQDFDDIGRALGQDGALAGDSTTTTFAVIYSTQS